MLRAMMKMVLAVGLLPVCLPTHVNAEPEPVAATASLKVKAGPLVIPSFRKQQLEICLMVENLTDKPLALTTKATITDFETKEVASSPKAQMLALEPKFAGEKSFVIPAQGLQTWSHWDPQLLLLDVELSQGPGPALKLPQVRFGYREMWTEKGSFYINGKKVLLVGGNHAGRRSDGEVKYAKLARFTADTIRGSYAANKKTCDLADRSGHYNFFWFTPSVEGDRTWLYEFGNHPSIVGLATWVEGYYSGPHGHPMQIGGVTPDEVKAKEEAYKYPRKLNEIDPIHVVGHYVRGIGGNFRSLMWDLGWGVPAQSQEEWMSYWAKNKEQVEPFFPQEFALMRLGANQVKLDRHYGESAIVEHLARYVGDESYRMFDDTMVESYTEGVERPKNEPNSKMLYFMKDYIYGRVIPAWRTYGNAHMLMHVDGHPQVLVVRGADKPSPLCETYTKVFAPVFFYLAGSAEDFVSKDHLFHSKDYIRKSGIVINDSADDVTVNVAWKLTNASGKVVESGRETVLVKQGSVESVPMGFMAPKVRKKTDLRLSAECRDEDGKLVRADEMGLRVFPAEKWRLRGEILLVDSSGDTGKVLEQMGVRFTKLSPNAEAADANKVALAKGKILVIGRNSYPDAVTVFANAPVEEALTHGLNMVVLEQMNRHVMGLRIENTGSREVYVRAPDSPLLEGLDSRDFTNWRNESKMLPSYPSFDTESLWWWQGYSYQGQFNKWRQRRAWHWSNKGTVATFCFEKPQFGNYRVLLDAGFDLLYTPLVEFQCGKGRVLLNQLDLIDHYGIDPVATTMLQRILTEYSKPSTRALEAVGAISDEGAETLAGLKFAAAKGLTGSVVFLLPQDLGKLDAERAQELRSFVEKGGAVLASVETAEQAAKLPVELTLEERESFNPTFPDDPVFSGLGMSELFLRRPHKFLAVTKVEGGGGAISPSGIAAAIKLGKGRIVVLQVPSNRFKDAEGFWGRSKVLRLYTTLLSNLGGQSEVQPNPSAIGGWGIAHEWLPGYAERVPKKAPRVRNSNLYEQEALDWDPDSHVSW